MMSAGEQEKEAEATSEVAESSILDAAIAATKHTDEDRAKTLIRTLVEEVNSGTIKIDKNIIKTIESGIAQVDAIVSRQLAEIMHNERFQKLEGSWRGLHYLVRNTETGEHMKLKVLNCTKAVLHKDLTRASEFDQSEIFKKIYRDEFGTPGGTPYATIIGDYEFSHRPQDMECLSLMSNVSAAAFAPFLTAPSPEMFGFDSWTETPNPRDLKKIFDTEEYIKWRSFRDSEDSRFAVMTMPRVMARMPYGANTTPIDEFGFEEVPLGKHGEPIECEHNQYCWMNASYTLAARLTSAFAETSWCTAIRGRENGGTVEDLPSHVVTTKKGDKRQKCPTEVLISDRREKEFSDMGFLTLNNYKATDFAVFMGAQTCQKPKSYHDPDAQSNAEISARLPYIMAASRLTHYVKCIARDKIGSFMEREDCEAWLHDWIHNYVTSDPKPSAAVKARHPLAEAKVVVEEVPGSPGAYNARIFMRPWLQMEELNAAMSMVANIPQMGG
jgi:type VI secretion system protein ImpC